MCIHSFIQSFIPPNACLCLDLIPRTRIFISCFFCLASCVGDSVRTSRLYRSIPLLFYSQSVHRFRYILQEAELVSHSVISSFLCFFLSSTFLLAGVLVCGPHPSWSLRLRTMPVPQRSHGILIIFFPLRLFVLGPILVFLFSWFPRRERHHDMTFKCWLKQQS